MKYDLSHLPSEKLCKVRYDAHFRYLLLGAHGSIAWASSLKGSIPPTVIAVYLIQPDGSLILKDNGS